MNTSSNTPPVIVFIHGFLDGAAVWSDVVAALGARAATALRVDLPGMGGRAHEVGPYSLDAIADDVARQVGGLEGPVVLVGHSMGAQIAELVAGKLAERVLGLVLLTPVPLRGTCLPDDVMQKFRGLGADPIAQRLLRQQLSVDLSPRKLEMLGGIGDLVQPASAVAVADLWNRGHALGEQPSRFHGPVLVVRGEGDPFVTEEMVATAVAPRFANLARASVDRAGHWAQVEQPEAFAQRLQEFLASVEARGRAPSRGWTRAFEQKTSSAFADAFAPGIVLEASVLTRPAVGVDQVKTILGTASGIYEALAFTHEVVDGPRTYLEWEAQAFGGEKLHGITILIRGEDDKIARVAIHHRPLGGALKFSSELARRLQGQVDADLFHALA